jgi:hypothetical protein
MSVKRDSRIRMSEITFSRYKVLAHMGMGNGDWGPIINSRSLTDDHYCGYLHYVCIIHIHGVACVAVQCRLQKSMR